MSSMRNAVQRRNHKERSQPLERAKWGLLEKRKDYSLRAKDHNEKKRKLKALRDKAAERNDDEFYFGMMSGQTHKGRKVAKRGEENSGGSGKVLSHDVVKLMKTQDCSYLRTVLQSTKKARAKSEQDLVMMQEGVSTSGRSNKTLFDEEGNALRIGLPRPEDAHENDDFDLDLGDIGDLNEQSSEEDEKVTPQERALRKKKRRTVEVKRRQIEVLKSREESLTTALREVEDQRAKMQGIVGGVNKAGRKFKVRERRR